MHSRVIPRSRRPGCRCRGGAAPSWPALVTRAVVATISAATVRRVLRFVTVACPLRRNEILWCRSFTSTPTSPQACGALFRGRRSAAGFAPAPRCFRRSTAAFGPGETRRQPPRNRRPLPSAQTDTHLQEVANAPAGARRNRRLTYGDTSGGIRGPARSSPRRPPDRHARPSRSTASRPARPPSSNGPAATLRRSWLGACPAAPSPRRSCSPQWPRPGPRPATPWPSRVAANQAHRCPHCSTRWPSSIPTSWSSTTGGVRRAEHHVNVVSRWPLGTSEGVHWKQAAIVPPARPR